MLGVGVFAAVCSYAEAVCATCEHSRACEKPKAKASFTQSFIDGKSAVSLVRAGGVSHDAETIVLVCGGLGYPALVADLIQPRNNIWEAICMLFQPYGRM